MVRDPDQDSLADPSEDPVLEELAGAVADGEDIDWANLSSQSAGARHRLLSHLQTVAAVAEAHRTRPVADASADGADRAGVFWGHLRLLESVGRGAFGEVFRAWDTRLDREVALKLTPTSANRRESDGSATIAEGRLLARVRHPNVVTVYGAEQRGAETGLWMEFVRGRTLEALVREGVTFTADEVIAIGIDLAGAVASVHAAGVLHRDIKAQNVMRADGGRIVLMDFGAGREQDAPAPDLAGTPLYLAPEVLKGEAATPRSDVYSLGVLLYHLLTGSFPVQGQTTAEIRRAHEEGARTPLAAVRPRVPKQLARIIDRTTDPDLFRRQERAEAVLLDLQAAARRPLRRRVGIAVAASVAVGIAVWRPWVAPPSAPLIVVLPFQHLGAEPNGDLVAEGLTYELARSLGEIEGLRVRASVPAGADFTLDGSVTGARERLRISARLVRASDDVMVWTDTFDSPGVESSAAPADIALAIVNRLRVELGRGQRRYETSPDVFYQFLQARGLQAKRHPMYTTQAADLFEKVLAADPSYAPAAAGLASSIATVARQTLNADLTTLRPRLERAALEAIRLDPMLAEAQAAMGVLHALDGQWAQAEAAFWRALDLNRGLTTIYGDFVISTLLPMGRADESVALLEEARSIDPLSLDVRRTLANAQTYAGRYEDAIESARWVLDRDPAYPYVVNHLAQALMFTGKPVEALRVYQEADNDLGAGYVHGALGHREEADAIVAANADNPGLQMLVYCGLGDKERAFEALERLMVSNPWRAAIWTLRPEAALLRDDPRFISVRRRLGFLE